MYSACIFLFYLSHLSLTTGCGCWRARADLLGNQSRIQRLRTAETRVSKLATPFPFTPLCKARRVIFGIFFPLTRLPPLPPFFFVIFFSPMARVARARSDGRYLTLH